jgi:predicted DCC family thiol-disulfide oxidoreductase YuxK
MMSTALQNNYIVLFDGVCNLCNHSVAFITKHSRQHKFQFVSLQSAEAKDLLKHTPYSASALNTMFFITNNRIYHKSSAALRVAKELKGFYPLLFVFIVIPPFILNAVYDLIAKNRYKWFGKKEVCELVD